jgi:hypothetical protein
MTRGVYHITASVNLPSSVQLRHTTACLGRGQLGSSNLTVQSVDPYSLFMVHHTPGIVCSASGPAGQGESVLKHHGQASLLLAKA